MVQVLRSREIFLISASSTSHSTSIIEPPEKEKEGKPSPFRRSSLSSSHRRSASPNARIGLLFSVIIVLHIVVTCNLSQKAAKHLEEAWRNETCKALLLGPFTELEKSTSFACNELYWEGENFERFCLDYLCPWSHFAARTFLEPAEKQCTPEVAQQLLVDPKYDDYRISDIFRLRAGLDVASIIEKYHGSIMDEYNRTTMEKHGWYKKADYDVLVDVLRRRAHTTTDLPGPNTTVVHLRIGDVLDYAVESVEDMLVKKHYFYRADPDAAVIDKGAGHPLDFPHYPELKEDWNNYVRPLNFFSQVDWRYHPDVVLLGSAHMQYDKEVPTTIPTKSCHYVYVLKTYLERFGVKVTIRSGHMPDDDLLFASQAKIFVQSGGGFSRTIAEVVRRSGGKVINKNFWTAK